MYPYGSSIPTKKFSCQLFHSKKFYICANFEFRAKNFQMIYAQADRAIKDELIGVLKSQIWIKNAISTLNLAEVVFLALNQLLPR